MDFFHRPLPLTSSNILQVRSSLLIKFDLFSFIRLTFIVQKFLTEKMERYEKKNCVSDEEGFYEKLINEIGTMTPAKRENLRKLLQMKQQI